MTDFFLKLTEKSGFDEALIRRALEFTKNIDMAKLSRLFFKTQNFSVEKAGVLYFDEAFYPYDFFTQALSLCTEKEILPKKLFLYIYIALLETAFSDFSSRIKNETIFFDTIKKLYEGTKEYYCDKSDDGIYDYRFVANHVRGNILRLGEFEYQYGHYDDKKCIVIHLPDGADLSRECRLDSYRLARQYFGDYPIIGDSWLLYPENKKMLSADSKIVDFMNDFNIISTYETTDYAEAFHIFGRLSDFSYENLPKVTSLQRAYAERIKAGLAIGSGVGKLKH